jgi:tetratricopeptide (TPR) repeat protein
MDLTIIIPTRDRNSGVVECVLSLEHNEAEIIVVDDASEERVVVPSESAKVIRHDRHRGRSAAINTGLRAASHELVLIVDDDIYAAPDMVMRLVNEFSTQNNPKLGLKARVVWDPDVPLTLTMKWMEDVHKFPSPILLSKSLLLEHGGYDENFTRRLEDIEVELRLKQRGLELRRIDSAVGFQHRAVKIRDLVEREFLDGVSAVFLHAKFPQFMPQVEDTESLFKNEARAADAEAAVDEISVMETESGDVPAGSSELFAHVCRHYFLHGIFEGLKDIGGMKPRNNSSTTTALYRQAAHLEDIGELDEARRLFYLVLNRPDEQYWDGAEYHLGCIEKALGNPIAAHAHLTECLRLNPTHNKARRELNKPTRYTEVESGVFQMIGATGPRKVLFILFGDLGHVVNALPIVKALRKKFECETAWLTAPEYAAIARASMTGAVHETDSRVIPWHWIHAQGFTDVFFPEPGANHEEWEQSGLQPIDFMAKKCGVKLDSRRSRLELAADVVAQAEDFLRQNGLGRNGYVTAWQGDGQGKHWPNSSLTRLAQQVDVRTVVFGKKENGEVPGTVWCVDQPLPVIALLIEWSCYYLGPSYGISWLATTTDTPMAVFFDPRTNGGRAAGFRDVLHSEKHDVQEWEIYTNIQTVLEHVESTAFVTSLQ